MILPFLIQAAGGSLRLPAFTAYLIDAGDARITRSGEIRDWQAPKAQILWGGRLKQKGKLHVHVELNGTDPALNLALAIETDGKKTVRTAPARSADFGELDIAKPGWIRFTLSSIGEGERGRVSGLVLDGPAAIGAQFNLKERLNSASVHIGYPVPPETQIEWMYNEVKATAEPIYTFYEASGFSRGYFGMQINSPTERRVIFSVWDAGAEAVDRSKVGDDNRVKLLAKGAGVDAGDFGNEGTGGHSHLVTPWKTGEVQKFLLHAQKDGDGTIYTGYYFMPSQKEWMMIASFRAPKDTGLIRKMYSFIENFGGENGYLKRSAEFGPTWIRTTDGKWQQCKVGRFTHDKTGGVDRFDYDFKASHGRFLLQNGGFEGSSPKLGDLLTVDRPSNPPKIDLDRLVSKQ